MFGYITPALGQLDEEQRKRYRSFYCGVCHSLLSRYGQAARLTLSNDMTFLAVLLNSLYEPESKTTSARCGVHPLRPREVISSSAVDYAADMNILLSYYKAEDQVRDEGTASARAARSRLKKPFQQAAKKYPEQAEAVRNALETLWTLEKSENPEPDPLCNLSGAMLGAVFVPRRDGLWDASLYIVGESLGRFVYWMDAYEDLEKDLKKGRFNPLAGYRSRPDFHEFCHQTLELFMAEAAERFEFLPLEQDLDILRNVIYCGVWQRYQQMEAKRTGKTEWQDSEKEVKCDAE